MQMEPNKHSRRNVPKTDYYPPVHQNDYQNTVIDSSEKDAPKKVNKQAQVDMDDFTYLQDKESKRKWDELDNSTIGGF